MVKGRHILGMVDYNGTGIRNCQVVLKWELTDDGRFTAQGEIWNPCKTDIYRGGQCVDDVAAMFPNDTKAQRIAAIWSRWHLNDMRAGSPAQEAFLREHPLDPASYAYPLSHYDVASAVLAAHGLNPDPESGYRYGHAWNREDLPADVVAEIRSW